MSSAAWQDCGSLDGPGEWRRRPGLFHRWWLYGKFRGGTILVGNRSLISHEACTSSVGSVPFAVMMNAHLASS